MSTVGQHELRTQKDVLQFFHDKLDYRYVGNWKYREGNSNVEEGLLSNWLKQQGHDEKIIGKVLHELGKDWKNANLVQRYIEAFNGVCGHPADEGVLSANTRKANNVLLTRLDEDKRAGQSGGGDAYRIHAQGICTDFRKLLERTIEDDLLNQIIRRHRRSITTDNRLSELPKITNDDCRFLDELITKYSAFEHSQSPETAARIPEEAELRNDIKELKAWRDGFRNRHVEAADD